MFFKYFPSISYKIDEYNSLLTDISIGFIQRRIFLNKPYKFRRYTILEGERPEAVSYKLYDTVRFHWVILFLNNIIDPMTDWFMDSDLLLDFTEAKYPEIQNDITRSSGAFGINHFRFYYDEKQSSNYFRLDPVDEVQWRYRGGRNYETTDIITIDPPDAQDGIQATAYINRIDELGAITDIVISESGSGYINVPNFTINSEFGTRFVGEIIKGEGNMSEEISELRILPIGEQIYPVTNLQVETEINAGRREIIVISPENIHLLEEQLYNIMGQY